MPTRRVSPRQQQNQTVAAASRLQQLPQRGQGVSQQQMMNHHQTLAGGAGSGAGTSSSVVVRFGSHPNRPATVAFNRGGGG